MFTRANIIFTCAFLFVLLLLVVTLFLPAKVVLGIPVMMWFWLFGMIAFGGLIMLGVKIRER